MRSFQLTRGHRWMIFGLFVLCMLVGILATGAMLVLFFRTSVLTIGLATIGALIVLVLIVFSMTLSTALHVAMRPAATSDAAAPAA